MSKAKERFVEKARSVHGQQFDYSRTDYKNSRTAVEMRCLKCGHIFEQEPERHLRGLGCPADAGIAVKNSKWEDQVKQK